MYVYVYICIYVCIYIYKIHIYIYTHTHIYLYAHLKKIHFKEDCCHWGLVIKLCPTFVIPWNVACRLLCPWGFPGKTIGAGCHVLLQGIFRTQSEPDMHWQAGYNWAIWEALKKDYSSPKLRKKFNLKYICYNFPHL